MNDVAAVFLSMGEPYADRARDSIVRQTVPVVQQVEITGVAPFHRALNEAAARVTAPFFVQVDADMMLDPVCVERLRGAVREDTGIVVGELRDELMGRVVGVKLFRTECFRHGYFPDSISPDTDFGALLGRAGWQTVYVGRPPAGSDGPVETLGEHRPEYTAAYTFRKHLIEGRRYWHRGAPHGMRWRYDMLAKSAHALAPFSQLVLAHGLFQAFDGDPLMPATEDPRAVRLETLLQSGTRDDALVERILPLDVALKLRETFRRFHAAGQALAAAQAGASVIAALAEIDRTASTKRLKAHRLTAYIGLGHGVLSPAGSAPTPDDEWLLRRFAALGLGDRASAWRVARAHTTRLAAWIRHGLRPPTW